MKVYTETVVYSAPEQYAAEAPYQIAIIEGDDGKRKTVRITGERVSIGDEVEPAGTRDGVPLWSRKE